MAGKLIGREARPEDADSLGPRLRLCDIMEIEASSDETPTEIIRRSIAASPQCWTVCHEDRPVFVIGCAALPNDPRGCPWLLATDEVYRFPGALTRLTKGYVAEMMARWPGLLNFVDERNVASVRWLARIGFTVEEPIPAGRRGELFHPFHMGA